ncbi:hypothetical protein PIB30_101084 [Stylosanthes scabra]|uniref:Uncharacterized protein n=1 Tax=Stylosanthes scabra TaxID=79078 RepID=A0ABU6SZQ6_9FABA|nr:hypothetical protein [Stylosanthes scabra]
MAENAEGGQEAATTEAVQQPRELSILYRWVAPDVLGVPSILSQEYLDKLKGTGVIFGGGDLERRYRVEAARRGERVCYMNLDHPSRPHQLWVNEVMFTEFGIRVPFTDFQQRLLNRACVTPSQLHPNAWASIRCFELVTEWLELPQEPESDRAGFDVAPVTYKGLRAHQKETVDVLTSLFSKNNLAPKVLLGRPEDARKDVVNMAGNDATLNRLRGLVRPSPSAGATVPTTPVIGHPGSGPSSSVRGNAMPVGPTPNVIITSEEGSSNDGGRNAEINREVASLVREQHVSSPSPSRRSVPIETSGAKRQRTETSAREFSPLDRSFDASKFIAKNLLGPRAQEALRDYDPVESFRWVQWALLKSATIMKSVEPRLVMMGEAERYNQRLVGDLKALNLQKVVLEEQLKDVVAAKDKAEGDLKTKKDAEVATLWDRINKLESEVKDLKDFVAAEKVRADRAEEKIPVLEKQRDDNAEDAKVAVTATKGVLKAQLAVLVPEFDVSQIGFLKEVVDGKVVDIAMDPPPS